MLVLANWFACTVHCQLEKTGLLHKLAGHSATVGVQTVADASDEDCQICDWVVSGGLQGSGSRIAAPEFVAFPLVDFLRVAFSDLIALPKSVTQSQWSIAPPDLGSSVQFALRTALPVRAPSLIS